MAGQIVMEGFLNFRMRPWLRPPDHADGRDHSRGVHHLSTGEQATYKLLILSQVILSMQLPFAVIPLIHFTSDRKRWGVRQSRLGASAGVGHGGDHRRPEYQTSDSVLGEWISSAGDAQILVVGLLIPS